MIEQYQSHILKPSEIVDYSTELMRGFRPENITMEPMVGFKVLCKDLNAMSYGCQAERFKMLEQNLGFLIGTGCIIRESHPVESPDGFWVITFPVPMSLLSQQLTNLMNVLNYMAGQLGIVARDILEINISGRCSSVETEARLSRISIPQMYEAARIEPQNTPYKMGHMTRINEEFAMLRTMWNFSMNGSVQTGGIQNRFQELLVLPQLLSNAFR